MAALTKRQWIAVAGGGAAVLLVAAVAAFALTGDEEPAAERPVTRATTTTTEKPKPKPTTTTTKPPEPPETVWPLTGVAIEAAPNKRLAQRPVLVVKIDNGDPSNGSQGARPQYGINAADVVFEEMVEGSVTRFAALFHSTDAERIEPVRSARTTDLLIMSSLNQPLFAWSGANGEVIEQVHAAPIVDVGYDAASGSYQRDDSRYAPYNLYSSTATLRAAAPDDQRPPPQLFRYRDTPRPPNGHEIDGVHIVFGDGPGSAPVDFAWNGTGWARSQRGTPHVDAAGTQIAPANVIIRFTPYVEVQCCDLAGFPIVEAQLQGSGKAWILTGGEIIFGTWKQPDITKPAVYTDNQGRPIGLAPGQTWVSIAPPGTATFG